MKRERAEHVPFFFAQNVNDGMRAAVIALFSLPVQLCAAPLDAFLSAETHMKTGEGQLELAYDAVNSTLDIFKVRANDPVYGGTSVGDYSGQHLRGGYELTDTLSLDGGLWRRKIEYRGDRQSLSSWQVAAQYRLFETGYRSDASYALRLGAWGDSAGSLSKSTPTVLQGKKLDTVNVINPKDIQVQLDLLGTWRLGNQAYWSAFVGTGASRVTVGSVSATYTTQSGCTFNLIFTATASIATLAAPCGDLLSANVSAPTNVLRETSYNSRYYQAGTALRWHYDNWQLTGGYHFQYLNRNGIDDLIAGRGGVAYKKNRIVAGEILRKIGQRSAAFVRGQMMSNQFAGEIPFTYNTITANKFDRRYGFVSFGILIAAE
jgi:hypothetical protein